MKKSLYHVIKSFPFGELVSKALHMEPLKFDPNLKCVLILDSVLPGCYLGTRGTVVLYRFYVYVIWREMLRIIFLSFYSFKWCVVINCVKAGWCVFCSSLIKAITQFKCSLFRRSAIINCIRLLGKNITSVNGHPTSIFMPNFPFFFRSSKLSNLSEIVMLFWSW